MVTYKKVQFASREIRPFMFTTDRKDELEKLVREIEFSHDSDDEDDGKRRKKMPKRFQDSDTDDVPTCNVGKPNVSLVFYRCYVANKCTLFLLARVSILATVNRFCPAQWITPG